MSVSCIVLCNCVEEQKGYCVVVSLNTTSEVRCVYFVEQITVYYECILL